MSNSTEALIPEEDARAMVRLLSEVAACEGSHNEKKSLLMDGLCKLVSADFWIWGLASDFDPEKPPVYAAMTTGGFEREQFPKLMVALDSSDLENGLRPLSREIVEKGEQITRLPQEYNSSGFFERADTYELWEAADIGAPIVCYRPVANNSLSGIGIYRRFHSELFSQRESKIAHIVLNEVDWLHEQGWPWESALKVPHLSPRCRMALNLLLEGLSRKEVADHMGISIHTLNDYVKTIYEFYSVHSQAELVNRFRGGALPAE